MRKKIFATTIVAVVAAFAGYNVYQSQNTNTLSDLALANVEALAGSGESGESGGESDCTVYLGCYSGAQAPCADKYAGKSYIHKYRCTGGGTKCNARDEIHHYSCENSLTINVERVNGLCG